MNKEDFLWKRGSITLDEKGFHVSDDRDGVIGKFAQAMVSSQLDNKLDEILSPNGDGYDDWEIVVYRITDEDLPFTEWVENNPFDLEKEEIWGIDVTKSGFEILKGDDIRYLAKEAKKLWAEWEKSGYGKKN